MVNKKSLLAVEMEELLILIALILLSLLIVTFTQLFIKNKTIERIESRLFVIEKATNQLGVLKSPITYKGYTLPLLTFIIIDEDVVYREKYTLYYIDNWKCLKQCNEIGSDICIFLDANCFSTSGRRLGPFTFSTSPAFSYALKIRLPNKDGKIVNNYLFQVFK